MIMAGGIGTNTICKKYKGYRRNTGGFLIFFAGRFLLVKKTYVVYNYSEVNTTKGTGW